MTPEVQEAPPQRPLRDVVRHTFVYGSGYVTMAIAGSVLVPIYTHRLTPADYGLLGLMLVLYGLMRQVYDFGVTNSVARFFFDTPEGDRQSALLGVRTTMLVFMVFFGAALTAMLWVFASDWSLLLTQSSSHANLVEIVAVTLYAECLAIVPLTMIRMQEKSRQYMAITFARFVATLILSVVFVVSLGWGVRGALLANAVSGAALLLLLVPEYRWAFRGRFSLPLLRHMLGFGLPFFPVIMSAWFIEASDRYLLGLYRGHAEVGYYVLAYKVAQVMQIALAAFSMGWAPLRYKIHERPDARELYRRITTYYVLASGIVTVAVSVYSWEIVALISPPSYSPAASIIPLIVFGYALNGLYLMMVTGMGIVKRTVPMAGVVGGAAIANVGINILLIPRWGMMAAAITTVMANVIMVIGGWYYSQRVYPIAYDWPRIIKTMILGCCVVSAVAFVAPKQGALGLGIAALAWLVFVLLLMKTGTISRSETVLARLESERLLKNVRRRLGLPPDSAADRSSS